MIPVVVEKAMKENLPWKGILGANLGNMLYIDMTDHDEASLSAKSIELYNRIVQVGGLSLPTRTAPSASSSNAKVPAPLSEVEQLRRQVAEMQEQMKAATIFSQSSGVSTSEERRKKDIAMAAEFKAEGNKAVGEDRFDDAITAYTKAIELDSTDKIFYSNRSAAHLSNKDAVSAVSDAERVIELAPEWVKGYSRKGAALHVLQQYDAAIKTLKVRHSDTILMDRWICSVQCANSLKVYYILIECVAKKANYLLSSLMISPSFAMYSLV